MTAKNVYVRRDGTKGPLQRPYTGPYAVLTPGDKTFLLDIGGCTERISVDRLKPAFYDPALPVQVAKPPPRGRPPPPPNEAETTFRWQLFTRTFGIATKRSLFWVLS